MGPAQRAVAVVLGALAVGGIARADRLAAERWLERMSAGNEISRLEAAWTLRDAGAEPGTTVKLLGSRMSLADAFVRRSIAAVIGEWRAAPELSIPLLVRTLHDPDARVRGEAATSLVKFGQVSVDPLLDVIRRAPSVKADAADYATAVLAQLGPEAIPKLTAALPTSTPAGAGNILNALEQLGERNPDELVAGFLDSTRSLPFQTPLFDKILYRIGPALAAAAGAADPIVAQRARHAIALLYVAKWRYSSSLPDTPLAVYAAASLRELIADRSAGWRARSDAIYSVARIDPGRATVDLLTRIFADPKEFWEARQAAGYELRAADRAAAIPGAVSLLNEPNPAWPVVVEAAKILQGSKLTPEAIRALEYAFTRPHGAHSTLSYTASALVEAGDPNGVLGRAINSPDWRVTYHAGDNLGGQATAQAMRRILEREKNPKVISAALRRLTGLGRDGEAAASVVLKLGQSAKLGKYLRADAMETWASIAPRTPAVGVVAANRLLNFDPGSDVRDVLIYILKRDDPASRAAVQVLVAALDDADSRRAHEALNVLHNAGALPEATVAPLLRLILDPKTPEFQREQAAYNLAGMGAKAESVLPKAFDLLDDPNQKVRDSMATLIANAAEGDRAFAALSRAYSSPNPISPDRMVYVLTRLAPRGSDLLPAVLGKAMTGPVGNLESKALAAVVEGGKLSDFLRVYPADRFGFYYEGLGAALVEIPAGAAAFADSFAVREARPVAFKLARHAAKLTTDVRVQRAMCALVAENGAPPEDRGEALHLLPQPIAAPECGPDLLAAAASSNAPEWLRAGAIYGYVRSYGINAQAAELISALVGPEFLRQVEDQAVWAILAAGEPVDPLLFSAAAGLYRATQTPRLAEYRQESRVEALARLARSGSAEAVSLLTAGMREHSDERVRLLMGKAITTVRDLKPEVIAAFEAAIAADVSIYNRQELLAEVRLRVAADNAQKIFKTALSNSDARIAATARRYLVSIAEANGTPPEDSRARFLDASTSERRRRELLKWVSDDSEFLSGVLEKTDAPVDARVLAAAGLTRDPDQDRARRELFKALRSSDRQVREAAAEALFQIGCANGPCGPLLTKILYDKVSELCATEWLAGLDRIQPFTPSAREPEPSLPYDPADPTESHEIRQAYRPGGVSLPDTGASRVLPQFPIEPPRPSSWDTISREVFGPGIKTLDDVYQRLLKAVEPQYGRSGVYQFGTDGFALVTKVERFDQMRLMAYPGDDRWTNRRIPVYPNRLLDYLRELFFAPSGDFRMFVFLVTKQANPQFGSKVWSEDEARSLYADGGVNLGSLGKTPFDGHYCHALVYHFRKPIGEAAYLQRPSKDAKEHLAHSGLSRLVLSAPGGRN